MFILGIDPGNVQSAFILFDSEKGIIVDKGILENNVFLEKLSSLYSQEVKPDICILEQIKCYGMVMGETTIETVFWSGRIIQHVIACGGTFERMGRIEIKNVLCRSSRAKDGQVRQRLIDLYGEPGTKANPGITYKISKDLWSALAVCTAWNMRRTGDFKY